MRPGQECEHDGHAIGRNWQGNFAVDGRRLFADAGEAIAYADRLAQDLGEKGTTFI